MNSKFYGFLVICLVVGLIGGYFIGSIPLQQTMNNMQIQLDDQEHQIGDLQITVQNLTTVIEKKDNELSQFVLALGELEAGISERNEHIAFLEDFVVHLQEVRDFNEGHIILLEELVIGLEQEINNLHAILFTEIQIDDVEWNVNENILTVTVRNTGNYSTLVEFISVRRNIDGSTFDTQEVIPPAEIQVEEVAIVNWGGPDAGLILQQGASYVVRVTCSTGFYYEILVSIPAPEQPPQYTQVHITNAIASQDLDIVEIVVENTGSLPATITSLSIRDNIYGATWSIDTSEDATGILDIGETQEFILDSLASNPPLDINYWCAGGEGYVVKVTCSTGFFDTQIIEEFHPLLSDIDIRIHCVVGNANSDIVDVYVGNRGDFSNNVTSISIKDNISGAPWYVDTSEDAITQDLTPGEVRKLTLDANALGFDIQQNIYYVIRVTFETGYHEIVRIVAPS
jgi:hypothetical protein